jgi:hypothetical protein
MNAILFPARRNASMAVHPKRRRILDWMRGAAT